MADVFKVEIEHAPPIKVGDKWSVRCTAILSKNNRPIRGEKMRFYLNHNPKPYALGRTRGDGRATVEVTGLEAGSHVVSAQIIGFTDHKSATIKVEEEKKGPPQAVEMVDVTIGDGEILIVMSDKDHKPVADVSGVVNDGGKIKRLTVTDSAGMSTYKLENFTEARRTVEIRVGNEPLQRWCGVIINPRPTLTSAPKAP